MKYKLITGAAARIEISEKQARFLQVGVCLKYEDKLYNIDAVTVDLEENEVLFYALLIS